MLSSDILDLIKVLGNVEDSTAFRTLVLPHAAQIVASIELHACGSTINQVEISKLVDSGILKAMLDIFADYYLQLLVRARNPTQEDGQILLQIANSLLKIL